MVTLEKQAEAISARMQDVRGRFNELIDEMTEIAAAVDGFVTRAATEEPALSAALAPTLDDMRKTMAAIKGFRL